MLIPTLYKNKLPRELSFPVGAEILSEQLVGVPRFSEFRVCFSDSISAWKSKFRRILAEGTDYEIVSASLGLPKIMVYPVKRELRHQVREALLSDGLPKLRGWMMRRSKPSELTSGFAGIIFSPSTLTVYLEERNHVA